MTELKMTIPIFITARLGSTRLPRKHFLKLGPISVIEHIVRRCEHFGFDPIVCVPQGEEAAFREHTSGMIFGGDAENVIKRLTDYAIQNGIKQFHQLDGDDPFFSGEVITRSWNMLLDEDLISVGPPLSAESGTGLVGTSYSQNPYFIVTSTSPNFPGTKTSAIFAQGSKRLPDPQGPWPQRLTLDYQEDYHLLCAVNRMVGGYMAPRWAVDELFIKNPDLYKINWFRTEEWKERQLAERSGR